MDMGSLLGTILGTILNYKRTLMSTVKGPFIRLILTVAHICIHSDVLYLLHVSGLATKDMEVSQGL